LLLPPAFEAVRRYRRFEPENDKVTLDEQIIDGQSERRERAAARSRVAARSID